jgi:hypothetical protein
MERLTEIIRAMIPEGARSKRVPTA